MSFRAAGEHLAIQLAGATALFTTRRGGVSEGPFASLNLGLRPTTTRARGGEPRARRARRLAARRASRRAGRSTGRTSSSTAAGAREEADGQATHAARRRRARARPPTACRSRSARRGAVAMLHAGWRGLAAGVVEEGVARCGSSARRAGRAAIGPGSGLCCYEVGDEVHAAFAHAREAARPHARPQGGRARAAASAAGVDEVHDAGLCTICDRALFFSHRRDGGATGRQAGHRVAELIAA